MTQRFFFKKEERLNRKKIINKLFQEGKLVRLSPFKIFVLLLDEESGSPAQILISIPKKIFKKAVHRNLLKRRIREAYRLNKHLLYKELALKNIHIVIGFIYIEETILDYKIIEEKIREALSQIAKISTKL